MNSIIVYRNPIEQWVWESGFAEYFLAPCFILLLIFLIWDSCKSK